MGRDEDAFGMLVRRYGPLVLGICQRLLSDSHDAEDVFQATFFVLARKAGSFRRRDSLGGWLYRAAYRLALRGRARANHERQASVMHAEEGLHQTPDRTLDNGDPASAAAWRAGTAARPQLAMGRQLSCHTASFQK